MYKSVSICVLALASLLPSFGQVDHAKAADNVSVLVNRYSGPSVANDKLDLGRGDMVTICIIRATDGSRECQTHHNLKTTGGVDAIFASVFGTQPAVFKYLYLSTDATAPAAGDCGAGASNCTLTGVLTSNGLAPASATYAHTSGTGTATLSFTWTATTAGTSNIQKAAICNNVTPASGTCAFENTFTPVSLNVGDQLQLTWTITIS